MHTRSAKELRRSSLYDGTALSLQLADTQRCFGRYAADQSWCIAHMDDSTVLVPSDKVARYYTPTARALTTNWARAIIINNKSIRRVPAANCSNDLRNAWERRLITAPAARSPFAVMDSIITPERRCALDDQSRVGRKHADVAMQAVMLGGNLQIDGTAYRALADLDARVISIITSRFDENISNESRYCVEEMVDSVRVNYKKAVARSIVEYELLGHNPHGDSSLVFGRVVHRRRPSSPSNDNRLTSTNFNHGDHWRPVSFRAFEISPWTNMEFQLSTWQVQRQTGVSRRYLQFAYEKLEEQLCVIEKVQVDLQYLWLVGMRPLTYNHKTRDGQDNKMQVSNTFLCEKASKRLAAYLRARQGSVPASPRHSYCEVLLTDVGSSEFCTRLPLTLDAFSAHISARAASAVELLRTRWLSDASALLNKSASGLGNSKKSLDSRGVLECSEGTYRAMTTGYPTTRPSDVALDKAVKLCDRIMMHRAKLECGSARQVGSRSETCFADSADDYLIREGSNHTNFTCNAAAVLMSRQLRVLCERSLRAFAAFFRSFGLDTSSGISVFQLSLYLKQIQRENNAPKDSPRDIVRLVPSLIDLQTQADAAISCLVTSAAGLPHPSLEWTWQSSSQKWKRRPWACGLALDDDLVSETREDVRSALAQNFQGPLKIVGSFAPFRELLDGTVDVEVRSEVVARARKGGDTTGSLDQLARLCSRLAELGESVRGTTANVVHEPLFSVASVNCKAELIQITDSLRYLVADSVANDNHSHMVSICQEYSEVVEQLQVEPVDCNELRALQEYSTRCIDTLTRLMDEYSGQVHERVQFLLSQTQTDCARSSLSRDDAAILVTTCRWPAAVRQSMTHSHEVQQTRKRHLEMLVEGQQEALSREATNLEKRIEKIAEAGSLTPSEVQAIYKRIVAVQESLSSMRADANDIERQEKLLQLALTDNQTRLNIVDRALAPLAQLWGVVKEWVEKINHWQHDPLSTIDAQNAERSTVELRAALGAAVRELEERGDSRATPTRAGKLLQQEVKIFDEEQLPLLRLVCQPGMKERHWTQIKKSTRLESLEITDTSNLLQMLDVGLQHYAGVIEETCVAAGHEHALEEQLEYMERAWTTAVFAAEAWRGFYKLCGTEDVQQVQFIDENTCMLDLIFHNCHPKLIS